MTSRCVVGRWSVLFLCLVVFSLPDRAETSVSGKKTVDNFKEGVIKGIGRLAEDHYFMLQDDEPEKILYDPRERSFRVNEPLQVSITREQQLSVRLYSPRAIRNVSLWIQLEGFPEMFKLAEFDTLPPFIEFCRVLPFLKADKKYITRSGKEVIVPGRTHVDGGKVKIEIGCDDDLYRGMIASECRWKISFGNYSGSNWSRLLPAHAREAVAISLNMACLFSSVEFIEELSRFRGKLYCDNQKRVIDVDNLYQRITGLPRLSFGHVIGVNGLAGGTVFGLGEWCYLEHYADDRNVTRTLFHEFAHCIGYDHTGNMTYENSLGKGWVTLCGELYTRMSIEKRLPVYSRRFLNTRGCRRRYGCDLNVPSEYIIEDAGPEGRDSVPDEES